MNLIFNLGLRGTDIQPFESIVDLNLGFSPLPCGRFSDIERNMHLRQILSPL